jgi:hypothetical protein
LANSSVAQEDSKAQQVVAMTVIRIWKSSFRAMALKRSGP